MAGKELLMKRLLIAMALCQAAALSFAQAATATATGNATANAAAFKCGGIGDDSQKQIKGEAAQHDMLLTFSTPSGAYLADIDFEISIGGKVVLQGRCDGPLMLADLGGKGTYLVKAVANGREQRKNVTLGARPTRVSFVWAAS
jgi:hypothetical protein